MFLLFQFNKYIFFKLFFIFLGEKIDMVISLQECETIEKETRGQSKCKSWFLYRLGRITASKFKRSCRTKIDKPSLSLIKEICYPTMHQYKIKAIDYGCEHEKNAIKDFSTFMAKTHKHFIVAKVGLCINPKWPYFGASPDGMCTCDCCEATLLEVKCPYCVRDSVVEELTFRNSFLQTVNGQLSLKTDHAYYYQIQMQLALTEKKLCYLVIWTKKNFELIKVQFNEIFWSEKQREAKDFFQKVLLPELLGKFYTREKDSASPENPLWEGEVFKDLDVYEETVFTDETEILQKAQEIPGSSKPTLYCLCQIEDDSKTPMIACDSKSCDIMWYHLQSVGLSLETIPGGEWICKQCKSKK